MTDTQRARVALDAMGGDRAPAATVQGAAEALSKDPDLFVLLVGVESEIRRELDRCGGVDPSRYRIVHAAQVVSGGDAASAAVRLKDNSILRAAQLIASGEADAMVAAGNTGATVAAALFGIGLIPGVRRPGIAVTLPTAAGLAILCDAGANIHPKPLHLFQYGVMASQIARRVLFKDNPRVGLLNVGSEEGKGTDLERETAALFQDGSLNYVGNIEGNDIFNGRVDVVVCDGFVGNVVLKTAEGLYEVMSDRLQGLFASLQEIGGDGRFLQAIGEFRRNMDYADQGGAPLLGVHGVVIISHGRSDPRAIRNALHQAAGVHRRGVLSAIVEGLQADSSRRLP